MQAQALLDSVVTAYIQCALWSSNDDDGEPLDGLYEAWDFGDEAMTSMQEDCADFVEWANELPWQECWTAEQLGHDFWLTRNGHGAGFWDRYAVGIAAYVGDQLSTRAKTYGSSDVYVGDDGKLHVS
jgi:hypothetical protein